MSIVATAISERERLLIARGELWHYSKATHAQIVKSKLPAAAGGDPNAIIELIGPSSLQVNPWKFIRDLGVIDWKLFSGSAWARYLYFFLGEPDAWRKKTNVQNAGLEIKITGEDFLKASAGQRIFFRSYQNVVALRGNYIGPATLHPPP